MPVTDGFEATAAIMSRYNQAQLPVIIELKNSLEPTAMQICFSFQPQTNL